MTRSTAAASVTTRRCRPQPPPAVPAGPPPSWVAGVTGGLGTRTVPRLLGAQHYAISGGLI